MSILRSLSLLALVIAPPIVLACGSTTTGTLAAAGDGGGGSSSGSAAGSSGGSSGTNSGFPEAAHAPFPTIANQGVPAMATPKIVALTFGTDANAAGIQSFVSSLGTTSYWSAVTSQYGVGAATGSEMASTATLAASYTDVSGTAAGGDSTFQTFVAGTLEAASLPADANTIYAFFLPSSTTISLQVGGSAATTCNEVGGYHNAAAGTNGTYYYAVVPECDGATLGPVGMGRAFSSELDLITFEASHEIIEAVTDPSITQTTTSFTAGWYNDYPQTPKDDFAWNEASDGEIADFCVDQFGAFTTSHTYHDVATAGTSTVQRIWSVNAAAAGQNPCIPVPSGEIYFNAAPAEGSDLLIVTQNEATTVEVDAFSDAAKSWQVYALDGAEIFQGATTPNLEMSFAGGSSENTTGGAFPYIAASNGSKLELSVTLTATLSLPDSGFAVGVLLSQDGTDIQNATNNHYWPFIVTTTAIAAQLDLGLTTGRVHLGPSERMRVLMALGQRVHGVR